MWPTLLGRWLRFACRLGQDQRSASQGFFFLLDGFDDHAIAKGFEIKRHFPATSSYNSKLVVQLHRTPFWENLHAWSHTKEKVYARNPRSLIGMPLSAFDELHAEFEPLPVPVCAFQRFRTTKV
jgi:hypothetical protein